MIDRTTATRPVDTTRPDPDAAGIAAWLPALQAGCAAAFADTPVILAYAFGSRVWGTPGPESDLDVGYYCRPGVAGDDTTRLPLAEELRLAGRLSDVMGCEVDLRCLGDAPLALRGRVLEEGHRVYVGDDVARVNLERDLLGRYHDYKAEIEAMRRLRFAALAARASR